MAARFDDGIDVFEWVELPGRWSEEIDVLPAERAASIVRRLAGRPALRDIRTGLLEPGPTWGHAADDARVIERVIGLLHMGRLGLRRITPGHPPVSNDVPAALLRDLSELAEQAPPALPQPQTETWFEAQLVDGTEQPLANVEVKVLHEGHEERLTTDGSGRVRLDGVTRGSATLWVPCTDALRQALESAWGTPTEAAFVQPSEDLEIAYFREEIVGPLRLAPETPKVLSIQPFVVLGRLTGMLFDTNKDFLLPVSLAAIAEMIALYDRCVPCHLLVVGHTDTSGQPDDNEQLSLARAKSVLQYLTDDVDPWLARYDGSISSAKRWGATEDLHMIGSLPDFGAKQPGQDPVRWFQATRGLKEDGIAGPDTRRALITEYMARDGTTLPAGVKAETHGCGEAFPLDATGDALDAAPVDGANDPIDRRVELFFFGDALGVQPPPGGDTSKAGSTEYLSWRKRAQETYERVLGARSLEIVLCDQAGNPVPHAKYRVHLPAGVVVDGELDDQGSASIQRLPEGTCRVDFPDLQQGFVTQTLTAL